MKRKIYLIRQFLFLTLIMLPALQVPAFYDPALQRWPNRDPIGVEGGSNLYRYLENDPVDLMDPTGLETVEGFSNCLGFSMTGRKDIAKQPDAGQSLESFLKSEGWNCTEITKGADCKCKCEEEKQIVMIYKNDNPANEGKDPYKDPIQWGKGSDVHGLRAGGGCGTIYGGIMGFRPNPRPGPINIEDPDKYRGRKFCCCKPNKP